MDSVNFLNIEYIYLRIFDFLKNLDIIAILNAIIHFIEAIMPVSVLVTLFLAYVLIYSIMKLKRVEKEEDHKFLTIRMPDSTAATSGDPELHKKWQQIEAHISSTNPSDWRLAIIEADIMLETVLEKAGFQGDTIADKIKSTTKGDFINRDVAWEAHMVRNKIAHQGNDFLLNERDARRTIAQFKSVFEEFYSI